MIYCVFAVWMPGQRAAEHFIPPFVERRGAMGTAMKREAQASTSVGRNFMKMTSCSQRKGNSGKEKSV